MNLHRIGDITSELSSNLLRAIMLPGGLLNWFTRGSMDRDRRAGRGESRPDEAPVARVTGPVVLMGGAPVPDQVVVEFLYMAGGRSARVGILPIAANQTDAETAGPEAARILTRFGMRNVQVLPVGDGTDPGVLANELAGFEGLLLCGADPLAGLERTLRTPLQAALTSFAESGKALAGLQGGAAILGDYVLTAHEGAGELIPGLGVLPDLVVDPQFTDNSRFGPLVGALREQAAAGLMAVGIDAGVAVVLSGGEARVHGEGSAAFIESDPAGDRKPGDSAAGMRVHHLLDGYGINLRTRRPFSSPRETGNLAAHR